MNTFFKLITIFLFGAFPLIGNAQGEDLVTDRPDQTESPVLVPRRALQVESGFVFEKDHTAIDGQVNLFYNSTLLRYGVNSNLELRLVTEYLAQSIKTDETVVQHDGFGPLALGMKLKLADEKRFWPQAGLICHVQLKTGSAEWTPAYTAIDLRFAFANTLNPKWSLSYNLGIQSDGDRDAIFYYTLAVGYLVQKNLAIFIEQYSFFPNEERGDHRWDGGLTLKVTPLVQVDLSTGIGLSDNAPDFFVGTGVSFRCFK